MPTGNFEVTVEGAEDARATFTPVPFATGLRKKDATHYAIDNVLERLVDSEEVVPVRIGRTDRVDVRVRKLVLKLHAYSQSLPDPAGWLEEQQRRFALTEPAEWRAWFLAAVTEWAREWKR